MTIGGSTGTRKRAVAATSVGLFGILGAGNIGNDAQLECVLSYLRERHPDAVLDAMCSGPERVRSEYGIDAVSYSRPQKNHRPQWQGRARQGRASRASSGLPGVALKSLKLGLGLFSNAFRTARWVRRHDVVIVPGAGVLETTMLLRPWETPYAMFLLCVSGRIFRTKVALVDVGANVINQPITRWLLTAAARMAFYRSYRDVLSRDAMSQQGIDTTRDNVYADLVFGIPAPPCGTGDAQTVGVGVMAYYGTNDDRSQASELHASYVEKMKFFVRWLVDSGRRVRLFVGDTNGGDDSVVQEILADVRAYRPDLDPESVYAESTSSLPELMQVMAPVGFVVAVRYHNVLCALRLSKPCISIGYGLKHDILMAGMGMSDFCQSVNSLDIDLLTRQFTELQDKSAQLRKTMTERNAAKAALIEAQFAELSATLFPAGRPAHTADHPVPAGPKAH